MRHLAFGVLAVALVLPSRSLAAPQARLPDNPVGRVASKTRNPCENGKLVKLRVEERSEGGPGAVIPPEREDPSGTPPPTLRYGQIYYVTVRCGDRTYIGRLPSSDEDVSAAQFPTDGSLKFRLSGDTLYITRPDGRQVETTVVSVKRVPTKR